ncbi:MAG: hypothetical protein JWN74_3061 [Acidobacteriaceae bacterium]|nr:hypothetical protein [Acidobacteriaceae bacterium]
MSDKVLIDHLKEFHAKADTSNFNVLDFVGAFGNPLEALAYSYLFWLDFIEFEGMIFLNDLVEDEEDRSQIRRALAKFPTRKEVEQSFNQFEIPSSFFSAGLSTATDEEHACLAQRIAEMWEARLARLFPSKKCVVEVQSPEETNEGLTIVVYQA